MILFYTLAALVLVFPTMQYSPLIVAQVVLK